MSNTLFSASNWQDERVRTLIGRCTISIRYLGISIEQIGVHEEGGRRWVTMPSFVSERSGGRKRFDPIIRFASREERDEFSDLAIEAVNELLSSQEDT